MFKSVKIKSRTQEEKISYLNLSYKEGLVKFYYDFKKASTDSSVRVAGKVTFCSKEEELSDDLLFEINDLNNFWLYYDYYVLGNKSLKTCDRCGIIIKKTNNRAKYCKNCKLEMQKNWDLDSKKRKKL